MSATNVPNDGELAALMGGATMERSPSAQQMLSGAYLLGSHGLTKDPRKSFLWQRQAATNTLFSKEADADAQHALGQHYHEGIGTAQDDAQAFVWFLKAAKQGHTAAQRITAHCFQHGIGVRQDIKEASKWAIAAIQTATADNGDSGGGGGSAPIDATAQPTASLQNINIKMCTDPERLRKSDTSAKGTLPLRKPAASCGVCGASPADSKCGGCLSRSYCSRECQLVDWKGGHKQACASLDDEDRRHKLFIVLNNRGDVRYPHTSEAYESRDVLQARDMDALLAAIGPCGSGSFSPPKKDCVGYKRPIAAAANFFVEGKPASIFVVFGRAFYCISAVASVHSGENAEDDAIAEADARNEKTQSTDDLDMEWLVETWSVLKIEVD